MSSVYALVLIAALSSHCSAYVVSHSETDRSTASVLLKEEQSAEISCMTKGTGDYFWRKGETLYNSTLVAYFTVGEVSDDSQPYSVTENGTLHIRSVTLKDEGNYFCRVSSTENECYGEVKILVQASLRNFDLAIDRCDGESSCLLYFNPSQFTSLTCTALNAPPLMTLKWFNGAKEITEGIEQNEILPQDDNSRKITSTVTAVYGHPAFLTCQAVDPKRSNDDVRFVHAQVEMTVPVHESLATWIIVAGTLAGCFIVYVIFSLIKAWANRKKYKENEEEKVNLLKEEKEKEISELKEEKEKEISELKVEKDGVISGLEAEKDEAVSNLKAEKDEALSNLKAEKDEEIFKLQLSAKAKDTEISKLKLSADTKDTEISKLKKISQQFSSALANEKVKKTAAVGELRRKEEEIKKERNTNFKLQGNLKQKDDELGEIREELYKLKSSEWSSNNKQN